MQMLPYIFEKTPTGGCLIYGQITNIQRNINMKLKRIKFLSPLQSTVSAQFPGQAR